jgi:hypothetical protein
LPLSLVAFDSYSPRYFLLEIPIVEEVGTQSLPDGISAVQPAFQNEIPQIP